MNCVFYFIFIIYMSGPNNPGKIPDMNTNIKQFYTSGLDTNPWIYKKNTNQIAPKQTPSIITTATASDVQITGNLSINQNLLLNQNLYISGSIYHTSDKKTKKVVRQLNDTDCDDLCTLNPLLFQYLHDKKQQTHYGLLAQEVEQVFPSLVDIEPSQHIKKVNYQELIPIIIAKIKQMHQEIQELKMQQNSV
jgi:hypothetical protein